MSSNKLIYSPSYSPVLPHFLGVTARFVGKVTFNTPKQMYEFIDKSGAEMDL